MKIGCPDGCALGPNSKHRKPIEFSVPCDLSSAALRDAAARLAQNGERVMGVDCSPHSHSNWERGTSNPVRNAMRDEPGTPWADELAMAIRYLGWNVPLGVDENLTDGGWMVYGEPVPADVIDSMRQARARVLGCLPGEIE